MTARRIHHRSQIMTLLCLGFIGKQLSQHKSRRTTVLAWSEILTLHTFLTDCQKVTRLLICSHLFCPFSSLWASLILFCISLVKTKPLLSLKKKQQWKGHTCGHFRCSLKALKQHWSFVIPEKWVVTRRDHFKSTEETRKCQCFFFFPFTF